MACHRPRVPAVHTLALALPASVFLCARAAAVAGESRPPDFIHATADDLGYGDPGTDVHQETREF